MAAHKHAELIKAWADGAQIQLRNGGSLIWKDVVGQPIWDEKNEYRIKPAEPARRYPDTIMTHKEMYTAFYGELNTTENGRFIDLINAGLKHACDAGQIVTREEFDTAVGDRKERDLVVAREVQSAAAGRTDGVWDSVLESTTACEIYRRIKEDLNLDDIISRVK